jgi:lysophospholipase L1-like esterase
MAYQPTLRASWAPAFALAPVAFLATLAAGYFLHAARHPETDRHQSVRELAILSQARQMGSVDAIIAGDSLVERANLTTLCGRPALNAGIGGAQISRIADTLPRVIDAVSTKAVIIAVGVNDARRSDPTGAAAFTASYEKLVRDLKAKGIAVTLATIAPVAHMSGDIYIDPGAIGHLNEAIRGIAARTGASVVDLSALGATLPDMLTTDGVHLNAEGYKAWRRIIDAAACH